MQVTELKVNDVAEEQLRYYRFQARNLGRLTGRLFINDVAIHEFTPEKSQVSCNDIQNWLMPGDNQIVLSISAEPQDFVEDGRVLYECSLHGMTAPNIPDDANCLWSIKLQNLEKRPPVVLNFSFCFTSLQVPTSSLWRAAEVVEYLPQADREQILSLQNELVSAFKQGNSQKVTEIYNFVLNEEASIRHEDAQESIARVQDEFDYLSQLAHDGQIKFDVSDDVYFNQLAGNRVVQLCSDDGGAALKMSDDDGESIDVHIYVSKIDGAWSLVRR